MNCEILTACKNARDEKDGTFTIEKAFTRLDALFFPGNIPALTIAIRLCAESEEDGSHSFELSMTDLDGVLLGPPVIEQFDTNTSADEQFVWLNVTVKLLDIQIAKPDDYTLSLKIDGQSIANTTLLVTHSQGG